MAGIRHDGVDGFPAGQIADPKLSEEERERSAPEFLAVDGPDGWLYESLGFWDLVEVKAQSQERPNLHHWLRSRNDDVS